MKTARRHAREVALQALYAWQLSGDDPLEQARSIEGFDKTDAKFLETLLRGVLSRANSRSSRPSSVPSSTSAATS